jgi:uncharacterized protein
MIALSHWMPVGQHPDLTPLANLMHRQRMDSPCIKLCVIEPATNLCAGCGRSLPEIAQWSSLDPADRRRIMAELPARLATKLADHPVAAVAQPVPNGEAR